MEILEKLRYLIDNNIVNRYNLAKQLNMSKTTLTNYYAGTTQPSSLRLNLIDKYIEENYKRYFSDNSKEEKTSISLPAPTNDLSFHAIKYYPAVNGSMGGVEFLDNPNESSVDIVIPGFSDCKFAVNAYGDSMYPIIKSGQIVVMMEWKESFIDWGRIYFVVTKNGYRAIKYLRPSHKKGYVKCESENAAENPAFDVEINDIHKLFLVKGWICREAI